MLVAESGLRTGDDLRRLRALGFQGFLIGETLMRSAQPNVTLRALLDEGNDEQQELGDRKKKICNSSTQPLDADF